MTLIPLIATKESVEIKRLGLLVYETDQVIDEPGVILLSPDCDHTMTLVDHVHTGGPVYVKMRPTLTPATKPQLGSRLGYILVGKIEK